jgi:hypothetical protein
MELTDFVDFRPPQPLDVSCFGKLPKWPTVKQVGRPKEKLAKEIAVQPKALGQEYFQ